MYLSEVFLEGIRKEFTLQTELDRNSPSRSFLTPLLGGFWSLFGGFWPLFVGFSPNFHHFFHQISPFFTKFHQFFSTFMPRFRGLAQILSRFLPDKRFLIVHPVFFFFFHIRGTQPLADGAARRNTRGAQLRLRYSIAVFAARTMCTYILL